MNLTEIWEVLKKLVQQADQLMPGKTGKEKKAWCIEHAVLIVEQYDHMIPLLGQWADIPAVDAAQRYLIGLGIERCWTELELSA